MGSPEPRHATRARSKRRYELLWKSGRCVRCAKSHGTALSYCADCIVKQNARRATWTHLEEK